MATSKTLAPTNVTISIPAMTDQPDASVFSNCVDKEADAINALNSNINNIVKTKTQSITLDSSGAWGSWATDIDMGGYVLVGAYPNAWAPTTILCDKDGFYSISCPSKASQTLNFILVGLKANAVHPT